MTTLPSSRPDASRIAALIISSDGGWSRCWLSEGSVIASQLAHRTTHAAGNVSHHLKVLGHAGRRARRRIYTLIREFGAQGEEDDQTGKKVFVFAYAVPGEL